ncbi:hypothetical protein LXL04_019026 [Taraxacum kok-saghyz]
MHPKYKLKEAVDSLYRHNHVNPEAYTRLVLDCVRFSDAHQAKRLQSHMDENLYEPTTTFIHNRLLDVYAKSGKLLDAQNLFDKLPQRDVFTYNAMLKAYSTTGSLDDLQALFNDMPCRDFVSYNTVIAGLASSGRARHALKVFVKMQQEGFQATGHTFVSVLNACSRGLDLRHGKQVHGNIITCGSLSNPFICNALTDFYAKCGEINTARWLFNHMSNKNAVSWNSMISGCMKNGLPEECLELFHEMKLSNIKPDMVTVSNVLGAFFKKGQLDEAHKLFTEVEDKDVISWTTMISGYVQNGKEEDALMLFNKMLTNNIKPDKFTISSVVSSCARLAALTYGQTIHAKSVHMGVDKDTLVSTALVDMYAKCGQPSQSREIFDKINSKTIVSWNSMILGYAQNGKDLDSLRLYEEMLKDKIKPDGITFIGVLSACIHEALIEKGEKYFLSMKEKYGILLSLDHYACMIHLYGRSNRIEKAIEVIKTMPLKPNSLIWSTLLFVCKLKGDVQHAELAARELSEVDPLNAEPYITLSNLYAVNGRWKDVAAMRKLMNNKNIKKFTAFSWIEIDGKVYKFVSEDRTHPESQLIYQRLNEMIRRLVECGFSPNKDLVLHDVGDDEKFESICYHSEKLALVYGLMRKGEKGGPITILKNIRVCGDCHVFMKFVSRIFSRKIVLRDSNRFHHFVDGSCSCKDLW